MNVNCTVTTESQENAPIVWMDIMDRFVNAAREEVGQINAMDTASVKMALEEVAHVIALLTGWETLGEYVHHTVVLHLKALLSVVVNTRETALATVMVIRTLKLELGKKKKTKQIGTFSSFCHFAPAVLVTLAGRVRVVLTVLQTVSSPFRGSHLLPHDRVSWLLLLAGYGPNCVFCSAPQTCSGHGTCNTNTGACNCDPAWNGSASCDQCGPGYFPNGGNCISCSSNPQSCDPQGGTCANGELTTLACLFVTMLLPRGTLSRLVRMQHGLS